MEETDTELTPIEFIVQCLLYRPPNREAEMKESGVKLCPSGTTGFGL